MSCEVTVLADSVAPNGSRLITFEVEHWRAIHAEVLRHRSFSFSAASSRAIPGGRMIDYVESNPAGPLAWTTAKKGMQGGDVADADLAPGLNAWWGSARQRMIATASALENLGVHKSISNRLLEPFANIRCVITGNEQAWDHFCDLRLHWDAEPSIQQLAKRIALALESSTPTPLGTAQWHLPYIDREDRESLSTDDDFEAGLALARLSAARCARVSYKTHDGRRPSHDEDLELYNRLMSSRPMHASPCEHQAYPALLPAERLLGGNLGEGWVQFRKIHAREFADAGSFDRKARLALYGENDFLLEEPA